VSVTLCIKSCQRAQQKIEINQLEVKREGQLNGFNIAPKDSISEKSFSKVSFIKDLIVSHHLKFLRNSVELFFKTRRYSTKGNLAYKQINKLKLIRLHYNPIPYP
jgi:hypothetical protein